MLRKPFRMKMVGDEACRCHLKIPVYHGLSFLATRWAGGPVPGHVLRRLAPSTIAERLLRVVFDRLVTDRAVGGLGHFLLFLTQPGWKKWRWLRHTVFPSPGREA
jgi:hypothetical protein